MRDKFDETKVSARGLIITILVLAACVVLHWLNYAKH